MKGPYEVMMKCGHAANSMGKKSGMLASVPACVICDCFEQDDSVSLDGRTARCSYFGKVPKGRSHESNYGCQRGEPCMCERPSAVNLPFFKTKDGEHDEFYCGCWGWD